VRPSLGQAPRLLPLLPRGRHWKWSNGIYQLRHRIAQPQLRAEPGGAPALGVALGLPSIRGGHHLGLG